MSQESETVPLEDLEAQRQAIEEQLREAKKAAKQAEQDAKKAAKQAEQEAKKAAKQAEKEAEKEAKQAAKQAEKESFLEALKANPRPDVNNWYSHIRYIAPEFEKAKFDDTDRKAFARFKYAFNPADHTAMVLVQTGKADWSCIQLDSRASGELARVCANAQSFKEGFRTLADEVEAATTGKLDEIFTAFGKTENVNATQDLLIKAILSRVPHTMLRAYSVGVTVSNETYQPDPEKPDERKFARPHGARFVNGEKMTEKDVYDHLIENASLLMKHPDMCISMPKLYSNDPDEPALLHLDLDTLIKPGPCPSWDFYFSSRYTPEEAKVLRVFIFCVLYAKNKTRQMLYILDVDGFSGKSLLINVITRVLGAKYVQAVQKDSLNNQFSMAKVWDKILVSISDNKNPQLLRSEKLHMMTGGDQADIEKKGKDSFIARLQMKVIASGNTRLEIDPDATHERTRLIVVKPHVNKEVLKQIALLDKDGNIVYSRSGRPQLLGDPSFEDKLYNEFGAMLAKAREEYRELCPTDGNVILPESMEDEIDNCSADYLDIVDSEIAKYVTFGKDLQSSPEEMNKLYDNQILADFEQHKKRFTYEDFVAHLSKRHGIAKKTIRMPDGTFPKMYIGCAIKASSLEDVF